MSAAFVSESHALHLEIGGMSCLYHRVVAGVAVERSAQQGDDPVAGRLTTDSVKHTFVVVPKTLTGGSVAPAAPTDGSGTYSVLYWKEVINGVVTKELDPVNFKCVINGIDYLADVRKALGY